MSDALTLATPASRIDPRWENWWGAPVDSLPLEWLLVVVAAGLAVVGVRLGMRHIDRAERRQRPHRIFAGVCRQVGFSTADQRLLSEVARQQQLASPLTLLMSPNTLAHHASAYLQTQQGVGAKKKARRIEMIRLRLADQS